MAKPVPIGTMARITREVEFAHTLSAYDPTLPPMLSTPMMIGWMEIACLQAQQPFCDEGEITVGTAVNIQHRAPSGVGAKVTAEAILESFDGRFYLYRVTADDEEKQLGLGTIHRAVIHVEKFKEKLQGDPAIKPGS